MPDAPEHVEREEVASPEAAAPPGDGAPGDGPSPDAPAGDARASVADPAPVDQAGPDDDGAEQVEADLDQLTKAVIERDEYLDALRRLQADFENYKKRVMRQQTDLLERAGEDLVAKLLPVLDTVDLARQHGGGEGVEQIAGALIDVLGKEGLERIDPVGAAFDPTEHEAVAHEPADEGSDGQTVSGLMRAGWKWRGRVIRPAMVAVKG